MSLLRKGFLLGAAILLPALTIPVIAAQGTPPVTPTYQWHTFLGGDLNVETNQPASAVDGNGNVYITGRTAFPWDQSGTPQATSEPAYRGYLAKISPTGQLLWSKFFGASAGDIDPVAITLDSAGNIYIAGAYWIGLGGSGSSFVMETDPYGNKLWGTNFGGWNYLDTTVLGLTYDPIGNWVYMTGWASTRWSGGTVLNGLPSNGAFATFIAQVGNATQGEGLGWVGFYYTAPGNGGSTMGRSIAVDADSNLYVAGSDGDHVAVWKVSGKGSTAGQQIWERVYGSSPAYSYGVAVNGSSVYATGYSAVAWNGPNGESPRNAFVGTGDAVAFVLKLDAGGDYAWHTFYHGTAVHSIGTGIAVDGPNRVYVAGPGDIVGYNGATPQHDTGGGGHFILQLDDLGNYQWHSLYGFLGWDSASSLAVDPLHNLFVSGTSGWGTWNGDNNTLPLHNASGAASEIFVMRFTTQRGTPVITWSTPSDIIFGTALGSTQLNATANVPGTFVYNPPAGTVLQAGSGQTLSTTFTPTDATNYTTATKSVLLNVKQTPPATPAQIVVTKTLARSGGQVVVSINLSNTGGTDALNVQLTVGKIGSTSGTPLPQSPVTVAKGTTATTTLTFPGSIGTPGAAAVLTLGGTYTGGSFSSASRITIP